MSCSSYSSAKWEEIFSSLLQNNSARALVTNLNLWTSGLNNFAYLLEGIINKKVSSVAINDAIWKGVNPPNASVGWNYLILLNRHVSPSKYKSIFFGSFLNNNSSSIFLYSYNTFSADSFIFIFEVPPYPKLFPSPEESSF